MRGRNVPGLPGEPRSLIPSRQHSQRAVTLLYWIRVFMHGRIFVAPKARYAMLCYVHSFMSYPIPQLIYDSG